MHGRLFLASRQRPAYRGVTPTFESTARGHRSRACLSQAALSRLLGVSRQTVVNIERGEGKPRVFVALAMAAIFGVAVGQLFRSKGARCAGLVRLAESLARHPGRLRRLALALILSFDTKVVTRIRARPILTGAVFALLFGAAAATNQGAREHYALSGARLFATLQASGPFAFLILASAYPGLIQPPTQPNPSPRPRRNPGRRHHHAPRRFVPPPASNALTRNTTNTGHWLLLAIAALARAAVTAAIGAIPRARR